MGGPGFDSTGMSGKGLAIDEQGAALVAGGTSDVDLPTTPGAFQEHKAPNGSDGFIARLTLLPVGVEAYGASTPGCAGPLTIGVTAMPQLGQPFGITCTNAPANAQVGFLILAGTSLAVPQRVAGVDIWVDLARRHLLLPVSSNPLGWCEVAFTVPDDAALAGLTVFAQFAWSHPRSPSVWSASNALRIEVQP
jgi:hypothetical protein